MVKAIALTAALLLNTAGVALAGEESVESIEVRPAKPQVSLLGEVRESTIPRAIFYRKQKALVTKEALLTLGYLSKRDRPFGEIIDAQKEVETLSAGDTVVINRGSEEGVEPGDRYYIYRKVKSVTHPKTGKRFGHLVSVVGLMEVTGVTYQKTTRIGGGYETQVKQLYANHEGVKKHVSTAKIIKSYNTIFEGDFITPEFEVQVPMVDPDRPLAEKKIAAVVMAVSAERSSSATNDVLYINAGRSTGVQAGDIFRISPKGGRDSIAGKYGVKKSIAKAQVVMVRAETATAVVIDSKSEIFAGDMAEYIQERL